MKWYFIMLKWTDPFMQMFTIAPDIIAGEPHASHHTVLYNCGNLPKCFGCKIRSMHSHIGFLVMRGIRSWLMTSCKMHIDEIKRFRVNFLAPVVRKVDNTNHWVNHYPVDSAVLVSLIFIHWIVTFPVDSTIQRLNNRSQSVSRLFKSRWAFSNSFFYFLDVWPQLFKSRIALSTR